MSVPLTPAPTPGGKPSSRLMDAMRFYRAWLDNPRRVGAVAPSAAGMARKMASVVHPGSGLPVLELGPGTGVVTQAILDRGVDPRSVIAIERSDVFVAALRRRFPGVTCIRGDAFDIAGIAKSLGVDRFDSVVSSLPLLTTSMAGRVKLIGDLLDLLEPGRPVLQFSYALAPPVRAQPDVCAVTHLSDVLWNLPPARIWLYHRDIARRVGDVPPSPALANAQRRRRRRRDAVA